MESAEDDGGVDGGGEDVVGEGDAAVGVDFGRGLGRDDGGGKGVVVEEAEVVLEDLEARLGLDGSQDAIVGEKRCWGGIKVATCGVVAY
jgi:hypothetical protein